MLYGSKLQINFIALIYKPAAAVGLYELVVFVEIIADNCQSAIIGFT